MNTLPVRSLSTNPEDIVRREHMSISTHQDGALEPLQPSVPQDATDSTAAPPSRWGVLRVRNFRLLWIGSLISVLGDQVHFIALPWLVLQLTGSALALGTVLALGGIPRALLMLLGGALTDRFSPRTILLLSTVLRMVLTALLAGLVWSATIELWMLYVLALVFGVVDAFAFPADAALIPQVLPPEQLQAGNALMQGSFQLTQLIGPVMAGVLIALLGGSTVSANGEAAPDLAGIAVAVAFDSLTFLVAAVMLWLIRLPARVVESSVQEQSVWASIVEGVRVVWQDAALRGLIFMVAAINFLFAGPLVVGVPVLADARFPQGAAGFGIVIAGLGGGALVGTLLAGLLPAPRPARLGPVLLGLGSFLGFGLAAIGFVWSAWVAVMFTFVMGMANGYINILFMTWLQTRTPPAMLGRVMSLLMFASLGLTPVSMALAGALIQVNMTWFLVTAGLLLVAVFLGSLANPAIRNMGLRPLDAGEPAQS
jgi:MFS family permease